MANFFSKLKIKLTRIFDVDFKKQFPRFLVAGFLAVGTDLVVYYLLVLFIFPSQAKAISFLSGTAVAFVINKYWTFGRKTKSFFEAAKFLMLYLFTLSVNVLVNKISLILTENWLFFSFLMATGSSTILNFIGQKWWVFIEKNK